jgi:hypothetical protein
MALPTPTSVGMTTKVSQNPYGGESLGGRYNPFYEGTFDPAHPETYGRGKWEPNPYLNDLRKLYESSGAKRIMSWEEFQKQKDIASAMNEIQTRKNFQDLNIESALVEGDKKYEQEQRDRYNNSTRDEQIRMMANVTPTHPLYFLKREHDLKYGTGDPTDYAAAAETSWKNYWTGKQAPASETA